MQPVTINITNLVGSITVIGDNENTSAQIQENVSDALLNVLKIATENTVDRIESPGSSRASEVEKAFNKRHKEALGSCLCSVKNYSRAKELLQELVRVANQSISIIDANESINSICDIVEKIDELTDQISSAILGDCTSVHNFNSRI